MRRTSTAPRLKTLPITSSKLSLYNSMIKLYLKDKVQVAAIAVRSTTVVSEPDRDQIPSPSESLLLSEDGCFFVALELEGGLDGNVVR